MTSIQEINAFGSAWQAKKGFKVSAVGNYEFMAKVTYVSREQGEQTETCVIKIVRNGVQDGKISISEEGVLHPDTHHLDFLANYQTYTFDKATKALVVSGASDKMGGKYTVTLLPQVG